MQNTVQKRNKVSADRTTGQRLQKTRPKCVLKRHFDIVLPQVTTCVLIILQVFGELRGGQGHIKGLLHVQFFFYGENNIEPKKQGFRLLKSNHCKLRRHQLRGSFTGKSLKDWLISNFSGLKMLTCSLSSSFLSLFVNMNIGVWLSFAFLLKQSKQSKLILSGVKTGSPGVL